MATASAAGGAWPSPVGLGLGLLSVAVGQVVTLVYHYYRHTHARPVHIQRENNAEYAFWEGVRTHLAQPEGFCLLGAYLCGTWMLGLMPASYYSLEGSVDWLQVLAQLLLTVRMLPVRLLACPLAPPNACLPFRPLGYVPACLPADSSL